MGGAYPEDVADAMELARYQQALQSATPEPVVERHMPDWYLDFERDVENMKHNLRNEFYDNTQKKNPWVSAGHPIMNEAGINLLTGYLRNSAFSKNIIMTNFPSIDIAMKISLDICLSVNTWVHKHYALGDIDIDANDVSYVNDMIRPMVMGACMRALQQGERGRVQYTTRTNTNYQGMVGDQSMMPGNAPPQEQKKWLGLF